MSDFDYESAVNRLMLFGRVLLELDLDEILSTISRADALGPFIDPTAYMDSLQRGHMHAIEKFADSLREPQRIMREKIVPLAEVPS